jgi:hypothetical protein
MKTQTVIPHVIGVNLTASICSKAAKIKGDTQWRRVTFIEN